MEVLGALIFLTLAGGLSLLFVVTVMFAVLLFGIYLEPITHAAHVVLAQPDAVPAVAPPPPEPVAEPERPLVRVAGRRAPLG